jgi:fucose permease
MRSLLALCFIAFVSLGLPDGLLGVAWPSMRQSFGLPIDALGALFISGTLGYMSASFASGAILRLMRIGDLLALSCLATAITLIAYSIAPRWELIVAFGLLGGLGAGAIDSALNTFAAHNYSARTVNMLHAFYGLGTTMGPALMTAVLIAGAGWQRGYVIVGIAQLVLAIAFGMTRRLWPASGETDHHEANTASIGATLKLPATWLSVCVFILYCGLESATGAWLYTLLHEGRGVDLPTAGAAVSIFWGSLMAARIVFGLVQVRGSLTHWLVGCMTAILLAVVMLAVSSNAMASIAAAAVIGFACGPIFPWLISLTPQRLGAAHSANAIGVQIASASIGLTLIPSTIGVIGDSFGVNTIPFALTAIAALLITGYWLLEKVGGRSQSA